LLQDGPPDELVRRAGRYRDLLLAEQRRLLVRASRAA